MQRTKIDISKVFPNEGQIEGLPRNPRLIKDEKFRTLCRSIRSLPEMTEARDILVYPYQGSYVVIGGNMRLRAYQELGWEKVPCCILPESISVDKLREMVIQDNNPFGETDWNMIANEWDVDELKDWGMDLPTDWNTSETSEEKEAEEDDFSEEEAEQAEPRTKLGDVWQLGEHRLMCGDSTDAESVARLMNNEKADMVFTDPPYGYKYVSNHQDKYKILENDDKILDYVSAIKSCIKENIGIYSFCGWQSVDLWLQYFKRTELQLKNMIIWKKNNWSMGDLEGSYAGQYEIVLYLTNGRAILNGGRDTDIWEFDREPPRLHPTMKPIDMIGYAVGKSSEDNEIVLDVFGGSGSTIIACEQLNRKCRMMELAPHYCDVIIARWEKLTGKKAELING